MELEVTEHRDVGSVRGIADEWQALHDDAGDLNPYSGPTWPLTWLEKFPRAGEPHVLTVRAGARLVGVAPLYRRPALRGRAHVITPIGIGRPWVLPYEIPAMTGSRDLGRPVSRAVVGHLCERAGEWDIARLVLGGVVPWLEPEWLPNWSFTVQVRRLRVPVVLNLDTDTDIYFGRRNLKESFRRARNRLTRDFGAGGWSACRITEPSEITGAFHRLVQLHGARAGLREGQPVHPDTLRDPSVEHFVHTVVERMAARGRVSLYELSIEGESVASLLILHTATASYSSLSGASTKAWPYSAITYLQSLAVQDAQQAGQRQFCLSTGPNQAKFRWTDSVAVHPEFWIVGPRRRSKLLYLGEEALNVVQSFREERHAHQV